MKTDASASIQESVLEEFPRLNPNISIASLEEPGFRQVEVNHKGSNKSIKRINYIKNYEKYKKAKRIENYSSRHGPKIISETSNERSRKLN